MTNEIPTILLNASTPKTVTAEIAAFIKGADGVVTPELQTLADGAQAAAIQAEASEGVAVSSAQDAATALVEVRTIQSQLPTVPMFIDLQAQVDAIPADPGNAVTIWSIPAKAFDLVQGVPTFGVITGRLAAWQFPLDTAAYVAAPLALPSTWLTMDVYVQWVNQVANTGNVVWGGEIHQWGIGDSINVTPVGGSGIFAANASPWVVTESKIAADLAVNPSKNTTLRVARQGASGNDTLPNSAAIIAIRLAKKT